MELDMSQCAVALGLKADEVKSIPDTAWKEHCVSKGGCTAEDLATDTASAVSHAKGETGHLFHMRDMPDWDGLRKTAWGRKLHRRYVLLANVQKYMEVKSEALGAELERSVRPSDRPTDRTTREGTPHPVLLTASKMHQGVVALFVPYCSV